MRDAAAELHERAPLPPLCAGVANRTAYAIVHETADGVVRWTRTLSASAISIAADPRNGDVVVAGTLTGSVDFGRGMVTSRPSDQNNVYVATRRKYSDG
jgi:hypothetical protein